MKIPAGAKKPELSEAAWHDRAQPASPSESNALDEPAAQTVRTPVTSGPPPEIGSSLLCSQLRDSLDVADRLDRIVDAFERGTDLAVAQASAEQLIASGRLDDHQLQRLATAHARATSRYVVAKALERYEKLQADTRELLSSAKGCAPQEAEALLESVFTLLDDGVLPETEQRNLAAAAAQLAQTYGPGRTAAQVPWKARTEKERAHKEATQLLQGLRAAIANQKCTQLPPEIFRMAAGRVGQGLLEPQLALDLAQTLADALRQRAHVHWNQRADDIGSARHTDILARMNTEELELLQKEAARTITSGVVEEPKIDEVALTNLAVMQKLGML